ncbi:MAG TPA: hypothetical protein VFK97_02880 [Candidatus Saccharimonadales bacterium]|nr:hypothetical protein [Candidatus Saccharimonadales bacterium]
MKNVITGGSRNWTRQAEMAVICPSITAYSTDEYHQQIENIAHLAERIHIDLMDGHFTKKANLGPADAWWPVGIKADFHLMYRQPDKAVALILEHQPNLIIIHAEADGNFEALANQCHSLGVKIGVALLPSTAPAAIERSLNRIDHVLVFSGNLGEYGGHANLDLLRKVNHIRQLAPNIEIGWDGGINQQNISQLAFGGVDVFNIGGFLQSAADTATAFHSLQRIAEETGTT